MRRAEYGAAGRLTMRERQYRTGRIWAGLHIVHGSLLISEMPNEQCAKFQAADWIRRLKV